MSSGKFGAPVAKFYYGVIDDVLSAIRDRFNEEYGDDNMLNELKRMWTSKLNESEAVDTNESEPRTMPATAYQNMVVPQQQQPIKINSVSTQPRIPIQPQPASVSITPAARTANMALPQSVQGVYQQQQQQQQQGSFVVGGGSGMQRVALMVPTSSQLQQHGQLTVKPEEAQIKLPQADGMHSDSNSDSDDDDAGPGTDEPIGTNAPQDNEEHNEEASLCSDDDVSDEEPEMLFDTDNIVVCQYDKINRARNKWKFHLKDGIMNLNGRDYIFQKATGEAEW